VVLSIFVISLTLVEGKKCQLPIIYTIYEIKFMRSNRSTGRFLQQRIRTKRYNKSFVPTAIRLYNDQVHRKLL